jgi:hypothetical protein
MLMWWLGNNRVYTGRFIMFSVITNIYKKKTKGPSLMELFTATGKLKNFFWQLEMFDVCTTGDTAHIDTIFSFLPHMLRHGEYHIGVCRVTRGAQIEHLYLSKNNLFSFPVAVNNSIKVCPLVFLL